MARRSVFSAWLANLFGRNIAGSAISVLQGVISECTHAHSVISVSDALPVIVHGFGIALGLTTTVNSCCSSSPLLSVSACSIISPMLVSALPNSLQLASYSALTPCSLLRLYEFRHLHQPPRYLSFVSSAHRDLRHDNVRSVPGRRSALGYSPAYMDECAPGIAVLASRQTDDDTGSIQPRPLRLHGRTRGC
jgi:hypothetical protein